MGETTAGLIDLLNDESGTSTVEYAILLALVVVAVIVAYRQLGTSTSNLAAGSTEQLPDTGGPPRPSP